MKFSANHLGRREIMIIVEIEGKKYKLTFWKWLAYTNQRKLNKIEQKIDELLNNCADKSTNKTSDDSNTRTD